MYAQDNNSLPVWFILSPAYHHISTNSQPFLVGIVSQHSDDSLLQNSIFDEYGDLHHRAIQTLNIFCDLPSLPSGEPLTHAYLHDSNPAEEDWKSLRPYFGWQSEQVIKNTYQVTSRFGGTIPQHDYLKKHFKSRNPVFNIPRRNEAVATDTIFSDVEKSVFSIWVDLLLCRSIQLLVLSYAEMFVYMYLSQLMSTFTNYLKVHHLLDGFFIP